MCREEAINLSSLKPRFDAHGVTLNAVVKETLGVEDFRPYFKGDVFLDPEKVFYGPKERWFPVLGVLRFNFIRHVYALSKKNIPGNLKGEGLLLGGVFVIGPGQSGIYYQHHEMEFGDHANLTEVLEAVQRIEKDASKRQ